MTNDIDDLGDLSTDTDLVAWIGGVLLIGGAFLVVILGAIVIAGLLLLA